MKGCIQMSKKKKQKKKGQEMVEEIEQDEYFYFIAGYTDGGAAYGITWEEAYEDGLAVKDSCEGDN